MKEQLEKIKEKIAASPLKFVAIAAALGAVVYHFISKRKKNRRF